MQTFSTATILRSDVPEHFFHRIGLDEAAAGIGGVLVSLSWSANDWPVVVGVVAASALTGKRVYPGTAGDEIPLSLIRAVRTHHPNLAPGRAMVRSTPPVSDDTKGAGQGDQRWECRFGAAASIAWWI